MRNDDGLTEGMMDSYTELGFDSRTRRGAMIAALAIGLSACNAVFGIGETTLGENGGSGGGSGNSASGSGASGTGACTRNAECLERSGEYDPSVCIDGHCVKLLLQPECPLALPQTDLLWRTNLQSSDPDPLIFGIFALVPQSLIGLHTRNFDLAFTELSRFAGGIPTTGGKRRRVLGVVCRNSELTTEQLDRAMDHLVDDLGVPGIIASINTSDLQYIFERKGRPNHVFFMNPGAADQSLVDLVDDGLLWHLLPSGETLGLAYAPLLDRTIRHLRRHAVLDEDAEARVALVTTSDIRSLNSLSNGVLASTYLNGKKLEENAPDHFLSLSIGSSVFAEQAPDYTDAIQALIAFRPHVVIALAATEFLTTFIPALELGLSDAPPFYLLSPWHVGDSALGPLNTLRPRVFSRVAGVNYATAEDQTLYRQYLSRFNAAYPAFAGPDSEGWENYYDAPYFLLHAAAAAPRGDRLTGPDMVQGMRRLFSGAEQFSVGPDDLNPIFAALETPGRSITLNGALGPPNFDPMTGGRYSPGSVWCMDAGSRVYFDVLRMGSDGNLFGKFHCFKFDEP